MAKLILGIESSCDDTSLALVDEYGSVHGISSFSQIDIHRAFGGVVPEVASRSHLERLEPLFSDLLPRSASGSIVAIAATCTPGLIGPLLVGASFARGLAKGWGLPFLGVHHLRAHVASIFLDNPTPKTLRERAKEHPPALIVLVSGGHTQVLALSSEMALEVLATSADDAAGECFDKSAKAMGLPYPGGPSIESLACKLLETDRTQALDIAQKLPRPKASSGFSFAGLKTAIRQFVEAHPDLAQAPALAWAVQEAIGDTLVRTVTNVIEHHASEFERIFFCGGVSANKSIRGKMAQLARKHNLPLDLPPIKYSTDNGAMIAACGWMQGQQFSVKSVAARQGL